MTIEDLDNLLDPCKKNRNYLKLSPHISSRFVMSNEVKHLFRFTLFLEIPHFARLRSE